MDGVMSDNSPSSSGTVAGPDSFLGFYESEVVRQVRQATLVLGSAVTATSVVRHLTARGIVTDYEHDDAGNLEQLSTPPITMKRPMKKISSVSSTCSTA